MSTKEYWYQKRGLKHVTAFLTEEKRDTLKKIAKQNDLTLTHYVTRLLERHIEEIKKEEGTRGL